MFKSWRMHRWFGLPLGGFMECGLLNNCTVKDFRFPSKGFAVDVVGLANALGLSVEVTELPPGVFGAIERRNSHFTIKAPKIRSEGIQRCIIAHELGHYAFHSHRIGDGVKETYLLGSHVYDEKMEKEATDFAYNLLMPWESMDRAILYNDRVPGKLEDILAGVFNVSLIAMLIRMGIKA